MTHKKTVISNGLCAIISQMAVGESIRLKRKFLAPLEDFLKPENGKWQAIPDNTECFTLKRLKT